ncbi:CaiB/BaiF CoA transferase family protein [Enterovirga rhinocerotis]|uniref:Formyl-CoA transferase n=1 Tax=Enterovirga rhinocerotis TaxID=1339210 RepID=A0A4V3DXB5_9HYPH|nr:CoA transferase [Enterovirga rhinocerotis]TDR88069.1 formyl-CoA transferase [Enterovirga rhinocerotis]
MLSDVLAGLKVVDLTQNVAGPYCTQILGDLGAEVIKVERPGRGDDTRDWRPPEIGGQSATFLSLNRNKRSIAIDVGSPEGIEVLKALIGSADIFIHSMKPGSAEARGLGAEVLRAAHPGLIYCAISAFGSVGPLSRLPGYDPLMQAFTGIMSTTGHEGDDPVRVGVSLIDMGTGMWAALGILAAAMQRQKTGQGMLVEASLMETGIAWMTVFVAGYVATQKLPRKIGSAMAMTAPYETFRSRDGHVFIAAGNDRLFRAVAEAFGHPEWTEDERFRTNQGRIANRAALHDAIEAVTSAMDAKDAVAALRRAGAPCSELHDLGQMMAHEQVAASGMIAELPLPDAPDHRVVALPVKGDGKRPNRFVAASGLGADTDAIAVSLGFDEATIGQMKARGILG